MSNKQESEELVVMQTSADVIFQQDKAVIDSQIATAHAFPRDIQKAMKNALAIVTLDAETAATCTYSVPRGGKAITGPSVHLAKILAQQWGNMRVEAKVIDIGADQITSQAIAFDLESNLAIKVEVKRAIVGKYGRFNTDLITVTGNAANSIAMRNAILAVIPKAVVDKAYKAAQQTITGDVSNEPKLVARRKQVVDALKDAYGVSEEEILAAVGKTAQSQLTSDDLVTLIGIGTAIKEGDTTVDYAFKGKKDGKEEITEEDWVKLQTLLDSKVAAIGKKVYDDAKRIIGNKEVTSYKKMHKILTDAKE